jgi:hypothetical protein
MDQIARRLKLLTREPVNPTQITPLQLFTIIPIQTKEQNQSDYLLKSIQTVRMFRRMISLLQERIVGMSIFREVECSRQEKPENLTRQGFLDLANQGVQGLDLFQRFK